MTDATEGVERSRLKPSFLRRTIAPQNSNIEAAYAEVYADMEHVDTQTAFVSPDTYKLLLNGTYAFSRPPVKAHKEYEAGKVEESEPFKEKFVRNTAWMKDQRAEDVESRKSAWERGVREGLNGFEDHMT